MTEISSNTAASPLSDELKLRVRRAQVDLLWRNSVPGYAATALIALILTATLSKSLAMGIRLWFIGVLVITLARVALLYVYRTTPRSRIDPHKWGGIFVASSGTMGIAWGILSGVLFAQADQHGQTLIAITVAGIVAGAVVTNGFIAAAYYAFLVPALLPLILNAFQGSAQFGVPLGVLALIFAFFMFMSARRTNQSLVENLVAIYRLEEITRELNRAQHDQLTGLPTRSLLFDRLDHAILHADRHRKQLAVLFIDLDGFKQFNDTHGHDAGDELLRRVAQRLKDSVRAEDTVARHGGDEFVLVLGDISNPADVEPIVRKLLAQVAAVRIDGAPARALTASIGVAFYPGDGRDGARLISRADAAMYQAKQRGKDTYALSGAEAAPAKTSITEYNI
jgi:diguanylate cyclase (GGDEF)-like protein